MDPQHEPFPPAPARAPGRLRGLAARLPAWLLPAGVGLLALAGALVLHLFDPAEADNPYPGCPFLLLTGLQCPGCGTTRALALLTHGDLPGALAMNPLTVLVLPYLVWVHLLWLTRTLRPRRRPPPRAERTPPTWALGAILGGIALFWVLRNLPWFPFLAAGGGDPAG